MVPPEPPGPTPIPVEGDVQIFADPECTRYADGTQLTVYVRINVPWGYDEAWNVEEGRWFFMAFTPYEEQFFSIFWTDWGSQDYAEPFTAGQIVQCETSPGYIFDEPQPDIVTVFTRP